jgi:hypothetical protein
MVDFSHIEQEIQEDLKDWSLATKYRRDRRGRRIGFQPQRTGETGEVREVRNYK